jgi:hypothetical protein
MKTVCLYCRRLAVTGLTVTFSLALAVVAVDHVYANEVKNDRKVIETASSKLPSDAPAKDMRMAAAAPKKSEVNGAGPPAKVPPATALGRKLADFIKIQQANGLRGEGLADAINKERARLGLVDDDDEPKKF